MFAQESTLVSGSDSVATHARLLCRPLQLTCRGRGGALAQIPTSTTSQRGLLNTNRVLGFPSPGCLGKLTSLFCNNRPVNEAFLPNSCLAPDYSFSFPSSFCPVVLGSPRIRPGPPSCDTLPWQFQGFPTPPCPSLLESAPLCPVLPPPDP